MGQHELDNRNRGRGIHELVRLFFFWTSTYQAELMGLPIDQVNDSTGWSKDRRQAHSRTIRILSRSVQSAHVVL